MIQGRWLFCVIVTLVGIAVTPFPAHGESPRQQSPSHKPADTRVQALFDFAVRQSDTEYVRQLIAQGADVNSVGLYGRTPLYNAVSSATGTGKRSLPMLRLLLESGANVNATTETGWTPLINASANWKTDIVSLLLKHRASVNTREKDGFTALMFAVNNNDIEIVRLLLQAGADPRIRAVNGKDALAHVKKYDNGPAIRELLEKTKRPK